MKKINIKQALIFTIVFIIGIFIVVGEGIYKKSLRETIGFGINIPSGNAKAIVYDIAANQSIPKRLIQPGKIAIETGHGFPVIVNKGDEPVSVQVKAEGLSNVQITSTDASFEVETGKFTKPIQPGKGLNLSVLLDISRSEIKNNLINNGNIEFTDYKTGKLLAELPVKVINSNVKSTNQ